MVDITLADEIFTIIQSLGTDKVFLVPGGGNMFLVDAAGNQDGIEIVPTHHEQAAVIAAEYYSRISGKLGVAVVTTGPGSTNAITGIAGAWLDSIPLLVLAGQVKISDYNLDASLRQKGPQEIDFVSMVKKVTKFAKTSTSSRGCIEDLKMAIKMAQSGRPGPAVIEIPLDIQSTLSPTHSYDENTEPKRLKSLNKEQKSADLNRASCELINELNSAKKPIIIVGNGVKAAKCTEALKSIIMPLHIPVCLTWPTLDFLPFDHELNAGRFGNVAKRYSNIVIQKADVILVLGSRLDPVLTAYNIERFGRNASVKVVDIDDAELKKLPSRFQKFQHDLKHFIPAMHENLSNVKLKNKHSEWVREIQSLKDIFGTERLSPASVDKAISIYDFVDCFSDALTGGETIITGSSGLAVEVFYTHFRNKANQCTYLTTGLGAMGFGLPALLGATEAKNQKMLLFESDGSLMMNLQELQSIKTRANPLVIFIMNNNGYASIRTTQSNYFQGRFIATGPSSGLQIPDIEKIAECFGFEFLRISKSASIMEDLRKAISAEGQLICEVVLLEDEVLLPKCGVMKKGDNTLVSAPLEDMMPLMPIQKLRSIMGPAFDQLSEDIRKN